MKKLLLRVFLVSTLGLSSCGDSDGDSDKEKGSSASNIKVSELNSDSDGDSDKEKGSSASNIKVSELNSECGCVESMNIVLNEMIEAIDGKKISEMSDEDKKAFKEKTKPLKDKVEEITKHCNKKFPNVKYDKIKDCAAVEELKKTIEKAKDLGLN